jgi:AmmeMemoRadiSam system protein A
MPSTEADLGPTDRELGVELRQQLLDLARTSIGHGLEHDRPLRVDPNDYPADLRAIRASFVTLNKAGRLRGCIGRLEATRPLVEDVVDNAYSAAFRDPRFPPLNRQEYPRLDLHISILSPATQIEFSDQTDLLRKIRPGVDGLILIEGPHRGTFLPSVWESLPEVESFFAQLKVKAGLPPDYWSDRLQVMRYTTESFGQG